LRGARMAGICAGDPPDCAQPTTHLRRGSGRRKTGRGALRCDLMFSASAEQECHPERCGAKDPQILIGCDSAVRSQGKNMAICGATHVWESAAEPVACRGRHLLHLGVVSKAPSAGSARRNTPREIGGPSLRIALDDTWPLEFALLHITRRLKRSTP
jgi:hypothetical protein